MIVPLIFLFYPIPYLINPFSPTDLHQVMVVVPLNICPAVEGKDPHRLHRLGSSPPLLSLITITLVSRTVGPCSAKLNTIIA